jgi:hypothetical protein
MTYHGHMMNGVAVLDTPVNLPDGTPVQIDVEGREGDFWQNKSVQVLSREQRVQPVGILEELAGDWPEEESVDALLALVREVRS